MKWAAFALSLLMAAIGAACLYVGYPIVEIERGWTLTLCGAAALTGAAIVMALGLVIARLETLLHRLGDQRSSPASLRPPPAERAPSHERAEASAPPPLQPPSPPQPPLPEFRTVSAPPPLSPLAPKAAEVSDAPQVVDTDAERAVPPSNLRAPAFPPPPPPFTSPEAPEPVPVVAPRPERPPPPPFPPRRRPVLTSETPSPPVIEPPSERLEPPHAVEAPEPPPPASETVESREPPEPPQTVEASEPAAAENEASPPALQTAVPEPTVPEPTIPEPVAAPPAEPAPTFKRFPVRSLLVPRGPWPSAPPQPPAAQANQEGAREGEEASGSSAESWFETALAKLDEPEHAPALEPGAGVQAGESIEPRSEAPQQEPEQGADPAAVDGPEIMGRYEADGTTYTMFADGSIEARSGASVMRFESLAALRAHVEGMGG